jgi:hypothetical protein
MPGKTRLRRTAGVDLFQREGLGVGLVSDGEGVSFKFAESSVIGLGRRCSSNES